MPRAIEMTKRREEELLKAIRNLSERTEGFTNPRLIVIGGYALRAFIKFSRFTRDCDFIIEKKNGWNLDRLEEGLPEGYAIERAEKYQNYGFMRWVKLIQYDKAKVKVSLDFMDGEIRGRKAEEVILIDDAMIQNSKLVTLSVAGEDVDVLVPNYLDYLIMKIVSLRASDIRDIASLVHENGVPYGLEERVRQMLPHPRIFRTNVEEVLIPEIRKATFLDSWRGIFATTSYTEEDKKEVVELFGKIMKLQV